LMFSNGILFLAVAASILIVAFGGLTNALIPLYAVGVFTAFTLSQAGMVIHHRRLQEPGWRRNVAINGVGAVATFIVLLIVAGTKFTSGAWLPIVVVPLIIALFMAIKRHYSRVTRVLEVSPAQVRPERMNHTVVVLVGRIHRGVLKALAYARSLRPQHLVAVYVSFDDEDREEIEKQWQEFAFLALLARWPGRVLTHRTILQEVWGPEYGSETQYLRVYASQLRKKLDDDPARPRLVTEPGVGYRLVDAAGAPTG